jgi:molybdopterin-guanine dinucleotide biosynthesis protein A
VEIIGFEEQELPLVVRHSQMTYEKLEGLLKEIGKKRSFRNLLGLSKKRTIKKAKENEFLNFNSPVDLELL